MYSNYTQEKLVFSVKWQANELLIIRRMSSMDPATVMYCIEFLAHFHVASLSVRFNNLRVFRNLRLSRREWESLYVVHSLPRFYFTTQSTSSRHDKHWALRISSLGILENSTPPTSPMPFPSYRKGKQEAWWWSSEKTLLAKSCLTRIRAVKRQLNSPAWRVNSGNSEVT